MSGLKGNFHGPFLGGGGSVMAPCYPTFYKQGVRQFDILLRANEAQVVTTGGMMREESRGIALPMLSSDNTQSRGREPSDEV